MVTFVTSLIQNIFSTKSDTIHHFVSLAMTGIHMCIYISPEYEKELISMISYFPNIKIMQVQNITDTNVYKIYTDINSEAGSIELPRHRNTEKDTCETMLYSHTKHEFIQDAIEKNPWNSTHFAWVDADLMKLVKNKSYIMKYLKVISKSKLLTPYLTLPGCWNSFEKEKIQDLLNGVYWRFCGGFVMGDATSMSHFCHLHREHFPLFLKEYRKLVWDFNFWAWMEIFLSDQWTPKWYRADHNESIFMFSADLYTSPLDSTKTTVQNYSYPNIPSYYPTSASYLFSGGKHLLNTRYVNYWIYPNGYYLFHNMNRIIENKNMLSELNGDTWDPVYYKEIQEHIDLPVSEGISQGLEDIRLYEINGQVKYIATTVGYSTQGKARMMVGKYDVENASITEGILINPPYDTWSEKNWIPVVSYNGETMQQEEYFIYKWSPMEIGKIDYSKNEWTLVYSHDTSMYPFFNRLRGSTIFHPVDEGLLGVVHFSEEHGPRHYYHMLVLLDKTTFAPIRYTQTFCFEKLGIEFCIGFTQQSDEYIFWISRHDRDPATIRVNKTAIQWV